MKTIATLLIAGLLLLPPVPAQTVPDRPAGVATRKAFLELFNFSLKEKRSLTFYLNGMTIPGLVVRIIEEEAVEVRNQAAPRLVIRIDALTAVALN